MCVCEISGCVIVGVFCVFLLVSVCLNLCVFVFLFV